MSQLIDNYYLSLGEVMFAFGCLVGIKVVFGYVMNAMMKILRDQPTVDHEKEDSHSTTLVESTARMPVERRILFLGLSGLWTFSTLVQVLPIMVVVTKAQYLKATSSFDPMWLQQLVRFFSGIWFWDPTACNIITILVQISIVLTLYLGRGHFIGKIGVWVSLVFGIIDWIFGGGVGQLFAAGHVPISLFPGGSVLIIVISILLLIPTRLWDTVNMNTWGTRTLGIFFLLAAAWQLLGLFLYKQASPLIETITFRHDPIARDLLAGHVWLNHWLFSHADSTMIVLIIIWLFVAWTAFRQLLQHPLWAWLVTLLLLVEWWLIEGFGLGLHYLVHTGMIPGLLILLFAFQSARSKGSMDT
ncbi:MAG: hypothetical protein OWR52_10440 [Acidibacillus sp.]|uniref:Uncharacterized protein n=1 Tax=Sulfoacidibacillus ferrooxidans TaxID=2005001 RepID=A0A9X2AB35_9BACL|nr:hypothetical protein [Sulfoacidibacillus ferrooxidans]MCI0182274.1 hypothetical protein [Sulfoacidibacillus ferrooxidans]MCY0893912.1 hypothetical protein [Acidibacillus sp.]